VVLMTCGGTIWNKDGVPSTNCTTGYTAGDSVCAGAHPCTLVYGADNAGNGNIGCNSLDGVNAAVTQDAGGASGTLGPVFTMRTDRGGPGSAFLSVSTELGFVVNPCTGTTPEYGPDHQFCTDDDPQSGRGTVLPQVLSTGTVTATVNNADQTDGNT